MAERFVIASGKGGVGKSTVTAFLGLSLAMRGRKVLLIDTDVALSALDILLDAGEKIVYNWYDVICGRCAAKDALAVITDNLRLLPPPLSMIRDISSDEMDALAALYDADFDFILIDAPAGIGTGLVRAAAPANRAIVVATPDNISVRGAMTAAGLLCEIGVPESGLIINRFRKKAADVGEVLDLDSVMDKTGVRLMGVVPECAKLLSTSVTHEMPPPDSGFGRAFQRIAARMDGEHVLLGKL